jgi:hypothetical protein
MAGDFNFYRYVGGDPVNFVDPSGFSKNKGPCGKNNRRKRKTKIRNAKKSLKNVKYAKNASRVVRAGIAADIATPEPSDIMPWKWVAEAVIFVGTEAALMYVESQVMDALDLANLESMEKECDKKEKAAKKKEGEKVKGDKLKCGDKKAYKSQKNGGHKGKRSDSDKIDKDHIPSSGYVKDALSNSDYGDVSKSVMDCMKKQTHKLLETIAIPHDVHKAKTAATAPNRADSATRSQRAGDLHKTAKDEAKVVKGKLRNKRGKSDPCLQAINKKIKFFENLPKDYFDKIFKEAFDNCK